MIAVTTKTFHIPVKVIHSPHMPNASKISQRPFTWEELQHIVNTNDLALFARSEEITYKYLDFKSQLKLQNTSVFKHMLVKELEWLKEDEVADLDDSQLTVEAKETQLFAEKADLKVLPNHFPYYFEPGVKHYCVWTKVNIPSDPESEIGDLSITTRKLIEAYVEKTFVKGLGIPRENLVWFRNWGALQSVKAISHLHVVVKGITAEQEEKVLYGPGCPLTEEERQAVEREI